MGTRLPTLLPRGPFDFAEQSSSLTARYGGGFVDDEALSLAGLLPMGPKMALLNIVPPNRLAFLTLPTVAEVEHEHAPPIRPQAVRLLPAGIGARRTLDLIRLNC